MQGGRESQLGSQPTAGLLDRLVGLGHTAGAQDERVLPVRNRVESDVQRRAFRGLGELDRFTGEKLVFAVIDAHGWQARKIGIQRIHAWVVIAHPCTAEPAVTEELQKRAALDVTLHPIPGGQHSFILGAGRVPEADQAIQEAGRWLRSKLGLAAALDAQAPSMHGYLRVRHTRFVSGQQSPQSNLDQETDSRVDLTS